jgi:spore coat protein U-like protein
MCTIRKLLSALAVALTFALPATTLAATKTATFTVTATVISDCTIVSASNINFGNVGVMASNTDATGTLSVTCTTGTPFNLELDAGTGTGSTLTNRLMANGSNTLQYQLYRDSARTNVWGTTIGTDTSAATGTGSAANFTVYGRMPPQPTPAVGTYTSTVTATIAF